MPDQTEHAVLRRMIAPPQVRSNLGSMRGAAAHIKVEFPRGADELLGLVAEVSSVSHTIQTDDELVATLNESDLIFALRGADGGGGILIIDTGLLASLIEVQTTGRISSRPAPDRPPSRTDGVVVSDMIDRWIGDLAGPEPTLGGIGGAFSGAVRENRQMDRRAVALALDPGTYETLRITLSLGDGAKTGILTCVLPAQRAGGQAGSGNQTYSTVPTVPTDPTETLAHLPVELLVDMARFRLPVSTIRSLSSGDTIAIPRGALGQATIRSIKGRDLAQMILGQSNGRWAIRRLEKLSAQSGPRHEQGFQALAPDIPPLDDTQNTSIAPLPSIGEPTSIETTELPSLDSLPELPDLPPLPVEGNLVD